MLRRGGIVTFKDTGLTRNMALRIPKFNKGGKDNLMNVQVRVQNNPEILRWEILGVFLLKINTVCMCLLLCLP